MVERLRRTAQVARSPEILLMIGKVYVPVLFPTTFLVALLATWIDRALGWGPLLPAPWQLLAAALALALGLAVVALAYGDLVSHGEGSPSPTAGRTRKLVVRGLYAHCRNPSVHGKLLGFASVGLALNSPAFCFVLMPPILLASLAEKVIRQEPQLVRVFGDAYVEYRRNVPLFVPRLSPWRPAASRSR